MSIEQILNNLARHSEYENVIIVEADFTSGTWNSVDTHELFIVTGLVAFFIIPKCTDDLTESVGGDPTLCLGVAGETDMLLADLIGASLDDLQLWLDGTPTAAYSEDANLVKGISHGLDIGFEVKVGVFDGGTIDFICYWVPLEPDATVVAGAGGSL